MAYPSSIDSFANPLPDDPRNAPSLAAGQQQQNNALVAVETYVGVSGSTVPGTLTNNITTTSGFLFGTGVPAGGTGVNGNLYLNDATGIIYRKTAGSWAAIYTPPAPAAAPYAGLSAPLTATSFGAFQRAMSQTATSLQSQRLQITAFTSPLTFTSTTATVYVNGTGTASTGSFLGLWSMDGADAGTLIASTANDTALFTVANARSKAWQVSVGLTAGNRYAFGVLQNGGSLPTLATLSSSGGLLKFVTPLQCGYRDGQTSMVGFTKANLTAATDFFYFELS